MCELINLASLYLAEITHRKAVALADGQHITQVDNIQTHNANAVSAVEFRAAVYSAEIEKSTICGIIVV